MSIRTRFVPVFTRNAFTVSVTSFDRLARESNERMRPGSTFVKILSTGRSSVPSYSAVISNCPRCMRYQPGDASLDGGVCACAQDSVTMVMNATVDDLIAEKNVRIECIRRLRNESIGIEDA